MNQMQSNKGAGATTAQNNAIDKISSEEDIELQKSN